MSPPLPGRSGPLSPVDEPRPYELDEAFRRACDDNAVRAIVLRAEGAHFCSGHDLGSDAGLRELKAKPAYGPGVGGDFEKWSELDVDMCLKWRDMRKPLIVGVRGYCIYHGMALLSCADVAIVAEDAKLMPGLIEYNSLPWDSGLRLRGAKEVLFLQRFVLPREAVSLGLVNRIVATAQLDEELLRLAAAVARSDPFYLRMAKRMVNNAADIAGQAAHARGSLSHWTSYRWGWTQQAEAAASKTRITADHGGSSKTLAPVGMAAAAESMYWSTTAEEAAAPASAAKLRAKL